MNTPESDSGELPSGCKMQSQNRYASDEDCRACGLGEGDACDSYMQASERRLAALRASARPTQPVTEEPVAGYRWRSVGASEWLISKDQAAAGYSMQGKPFDIEPLYPPSALAAAEQRGRESERERCAKIAERAGAQGALTYDCNVIAAAIRGDETGGGNENPS